MKLALVIGLLMAVLLISGCTQTGQVTDKTIEEGETQPYRAEPSSCDREAEAHRETDRALEYCKTRPYGTYRGSVCGIPVNVVC